MGVTQYTKMIDNNGDTVLVEQDRVNRFLSVGWQLVDQPAQEKKSPRKGRKNKITADAQVTSETVEAETIEWDPTSGEEWADSEESVIDETANKED